MKQYLKRALCAALAAVLLIGCLAGCSEGNGYSPEEISSELTGVIQELADPDPQKNDDRSVAYVFTSAAGDVHAVMDGADSYLDLPENEIPLSLTVSCRLDGKELSPADLAGKSGHLELTFAYEVRGDALNGSPLPFAVVTVVLLDDAVASRMETENAAVLDDGDRTIVLGLSLPGLQEALDLDPETAELPSSFTIEADVTDFSMLNAYAYATTEPFAKLDLDDSDALKDLDGMADDLKSAMEQLTDGIEQICDGLAELLDGAGELSDGVDALADGAGALKDGAAALHDGTLSLQDGALQVKDGALQLKSGASELSDGAAGLYAGLSELTGNNASLTAGALQVFETLLSAADTELAASGLAVTPLRVDNYDAVLNGIIASLDEADIYAQALETAREQVTQAVNAQSGTIRLLVTQTVKTQVSAQVNAAVLEQVTEAVTEGVRKQVLTGVLAQLSAGEQSGEDADDENENANDTEGSEDRESGAAAPVASLSLPGSMTADEYEEAVKAGLIPEEVQALVDAAAASQMASESIKALIQENISDQMASDAVRETIDAHVAAQMASSEIQALIDSNTEEQIEALIEQNLNSAEVQAQITEALAQASAGAAAVSELKGQLDSYRTFYDGLLAYTAGVSAAADGAAQLAGGASSLLAGAGQLCDGSASLADGAGQLVDGSKDLADGAKELSDGVNTLKAKIPDLLSGVKALADGAGELSDGLAEFDEEAVGKITSLIEDDLHSLLDRLKDTKETAERYRADGGHEWIFRTDAIGR